MRHDHSGTTEQQLRREVEELRRQLGMRRPAHAGVPPIRWHPSPTTISALLLGFLILLVTAFVAGYLPLQKREATLRAEAQAQDKALPHLQVMRVGRLADRNEIKLPGTMQAGTRIERNSASDAPITG